MHKFLFPRIHGPDHDSSIKSRNCYSVIQFHLIAYLSILFYSVSSHLFHPFHLISFNSTSFKFYFYSILLSFKMPTEHFTLVKVEVLPEKFIELKKSIRERYLSESTTEIEFTRTFIRAVVNQR